MEQQIKNLTTKCCDPISDVITTVAKKTIQYSNRCIEDGIEVVKCEANHQIHVTEKSSVQSKIVTSKIYNYGEHKSGFKSKGDVQNYYELKYKHCSEGTLFEDPQFGANDSSIYFNKKPKSKFEWLRPHEICKNPKLFVEGISRFDIKQGLLGDCWLLAALTSLTLNPELTQYVVPNDQSFQENYAGIFHFRFWQYGRWIDVVIDDRLPTYKGQLVYLHSVDKNEFWGALVEKAYAKLHGSYEVLESGSPSEALEDFTGGVTEIINISDAPTNLFHILKTAFERNALMGCSINTNTNGIEELTPEGLIKGHAYSITKVKSVSIETPEKLRKIYLLRIRNPWGNSTEWNGAWSDKSKEWALISEKEKESLGLSFEDDGEFWMSFRDFKIYFDIIEMCHLNPDTILNDVKKWDISYYEGEWVKGVTAGGCRTYIETFASNPQYRITLTEHDEEDDGNCAVLVALMQKNRRQQRKSGFDLLSIGYSIYHIQDENTTPKPLNIEFFKYNLMKEKSPSYVNIREVSHRFRLPPGVYCIIPTTFEPQCSGQFLIRIYSEQKANFEIHDAEIGFKRINDGAIKHTDADSETLRELFKKTAGIEEEINWRQLQTILNVHVKSSFSNDVCRALMALADLNFSGALSYHEFLDLWNDLQLWKSVFNIYDKDKSNTMDGFELRQAMNSVGYTLTNGTLNILMHRYGNGSGAMTFEDFLMCIIKLQRMMESFREFDLDDTKNATFSIEQFINITLYS